jgi:hypothetical protein
LSWRLFTIANGNFFTAPVAHAATEGNTKASTHAASSAVRGAVIREK